MKTLILSTLLVTTMTYNNQTAWKEIMSFLPQEYQLTDRNMPTEESWEWKGNKVHLDTYRNPNAPAKVILFHGVGTNGRQMTTILGRPLADDGFETIAIDMPTYGVTEVNPDMVIAYDDWVQCGSDYIDYELSRDDRPIILYGLSAGGMETYHVAAKNGSKKIIGLIGMTFLDQRIPQVGRETVLVPIGAVIGTPMMRLACKMGMEKKKMKMSVASKMWALVNNEDCLNAMLADTTSAGNSATYRFLTTYADYAPDVEPENFDLCPIILTQPDEDKWTPFHLAKLTLDKITKVPVTIKHLPNGSHYPIEPEALEALHTYALAFINEQLRK